MTVRITQKNGDHLLFTITGVDVSIANAIRRVIISEIPTVVFKSDNSNDDNDDDGIHIKTNTTRLNNEILKQRIGCIPIHITDITDNLFQELEVSISKKNTSTNIQYVTTEDITVRNTKTGNTLSREVVNKMFPPDKKTGDYIIICRLRPKISDDIDGEELDMKATMSLGIAKENGMYNVASTCLYTFTQDEARQKAVWSEHAKKLKLENKDQLEREKKNWYLQEGKRIYKQNSFDFVIETIGVYTNIALVINACNVVIQKLNTCVSSIEEGINTITPAKTTIKNAYDVRLENEDYTLGNVLQNILYEQYYEKQPEFSYLGFKKFHPHDTHSIMRIALKNSALGSEQVKDYVIESCKQGVKIFQKIVNQFNTLS